VDVSTIGADTKLRVDRLTSLARDLGTIGAEKLRAAA
jgi:hypothetical protein